MGEVCRKRICAGSLHPIAHPTFNKISFLFRKDNTGFPVQVVAKLRQLFRGYPCRRHYRRGADRALI